MFSVRPACPFIKRSTRSRLERSTREIGNAESPEPRPRTTKQIKNKLGLAQACPRPPLGSQGGQLRRGLAQEFLAILKIFSRSGVCPVLCPPPNLTQYETLPNMTECHAIARKHCWTRHLWCSVAVRGALCKSLILRAANLPKLDVAGSIPVSRSTNSIT
jgi:hypothetical protein